VANDVLHALFHWFLSYKGKRTSLVTDPLPALASTPFPISGISVHSNCSPDISFMPQHRFVISE
jgi:hypothetical protein